MAGLVYDKKQVEEAIDQIVARTMRMDMPWDWPCGVAIMESAKHMNSQKRKNIWIY